MVSLLVVWYELLVRGTPWSPGQLLVIYMKALVGVHAVVLWQLPQSVVVIWVAFLPVAVVQRLQRLPKKRTFAGYPPFLYHYS